MALPHSLNKLWRDQSRQPPAKKRGKPELKWTPSHERKLFRLITQANVPFNNIAIAIYEPEEPAEPGKPGRPEFAPCRGTCWSHWHKMTDMTPSQMQIKNKISLKKHREQLERAFEAYQERQSELPDLSAVNPRLSAIPSAPTGSAADACTPQLTYEGTTPGDLAHAIRTPEPCQPVQPLIASDEPQQLGVCTSTLEGGDNARVLQILHSTSTKRRAPSDFNEVADESSEAVAKQLSTEQEVSLTPALSGRGWTRVASGLPRVEEELDESNSSESKITTVAELEEKMGVPQGLISFVKYGLTKTRWSVQSVVSRFSSRRSSQSPLAESQTPGESGPISYGQFITNSAQLHAQSTPVQSMQPTYLYLDPQKTNLFLELRLAGATDNEVANRIRQILQDCSQTRAQQVVTARNPHEEIPLEVALTLGNIPACKVLLDFGADVNAKTSDGSSLSDFGRKAQKNTTTSQQYFAIGACRLAIREGRSTERPQVRGLKKRTKIREIGGNIGMVVVNKAQSLARGSERSIVRPVVPTLASGSRDQEGLSSLSTATTHGESRQKHVSMHSQQSNMSYNQSSTLQQTPQPVFTQLVSNFNQGAPQPPFHDSNITPNLLGITPTIQHWDSYFGNGGRTVLPGLQEYDPRIGSWALLPGNRTAFVLHDNHSSAMTSYEPIFPQMLPNQVPSSEAETFLGMNDPTQFPLPTVWDNVGQTSEGTPKHRRRYGMVAKPWSPNLDTSMPSDGLQLENIQPSVIFEGTMNSQSKSVPAFSNIYGCRDSSFEVNTGTNSQEAQSISGIDFSQVLPAIDTLPADSFESDVNEILFNCRPNENYVPGWDWRRPSAF